MSLLSPGQIASIKDAIKTVTDTFMVSPVSYFRKKISVDIWQETPDPADYESLLINGLVEFPKDTTKETVSGIEADFDVKVTFNFVDLALYVNASAPFVEFSATADYFTVAGFKYKVCYIGYDGPLDATPVLVLIYGKKLEDDS